MLRPFATAILFGAILAVAAWPMRDFLLRSGLSRGLTALLLLLSALAIIALPMIAMGPGCGQAPHWSEPTSPDLFRERPTASSLARKLPVNWRAAGHFWCKAPTPKEVSELTGALFR